MKYYKNFKVTGKASTTIFDGGIESTEAERKRILGIIISLSGYGDNVIEINIDREKIAGISDYSLDTEADLGAANFPYSTSKMQFIELGHELDQGQTLQVGIKCGVTPKDVRGSYVYELMG